MKKQLLIAAVAATMSVAVTTAVADISIKGDAWYQYANIDADSNNGLFRGLTDGNVPSSSNNISQQRVRLHVTGKAGDTTIKLGLRNDGRTRVSGGNRASEDSFDAGAAGSDTGISGDNKSAQFNTDYLYLTTKIGALDIKAGDWWDTTGLGVARKGKADADRIEFSTKVQGWKLAFETGSDSSSSVFSAKGKVGDFAVDFEYNSAVSLDGTPRIANSFSIDGTGNFVVADGPSGLGAVAEGDYFDVAIKGKVGSVGVAAEYFAGNNDTRDDANVTDDADAAVVHLWTKLADVTWHVAWAQSEEGVAGITGSGNKFALFGASLLGTAPGGNGATAIGNFGNAGSKDTAYGVRADIKVAGMGVQGVVGNLEVDIDDFADDPDGTFWDVIVTRPLGKGSDIRFSIGEYEDVTTAGAKISVKF